MLQTVSISSKRQITIPAKIYNHFGLSRGLKLIITIDSDKIILQKAQALLDEVAGTIKLPKRFKNKPLESVVNEAKTEYFYRKK